MHVKVKHLGLKYKCDECDYQANHKQSLDLHVKIKHLGIKFRCDECDYKVESQEYLMMHKKNKNTFDNHSLRGPSHLRPSGSSSHRIL